MVKTNMSHVTGLGNPNDDSHGQCYAPVEKGNPVRAKKRHLQENDRIPPGWVEVECDFGCHLKR